MVTNRDRKSFGSCLTKKFQTLLWRLAPLMFFDPRSGISGPTKRRAFAYPNLHEWWTQPAHVSCPAIDLAEIRLSSKISSWIWSIISAVFTVFGLPGRGASQVEKSPRLNGATQFLTVAYDGACYPNVCFRMAWISFWALPGMKKKIFLMSARVSRLLKSRASPDMLPFSLCNKKGLAIRHMNCSLFPTTLSIPSHDIGKYVGLRTYQHPLVLQLVYVMRLCWMSVGRIGMDPANSQ